MNRTVVGACCAFALTAVVVSAQDGHMSMDKKDHMPAEKAYSGCLESSQTGSYRLTHAMAADEKPSMMKSDSMEKDGAMGTDGMGSESLSLSAPGKDLKKYVGRRVTVTGTDGDAMNGMATFVVKSVKKTGGACS